MLELIGWIFVVLASLMSAVVSLYVAIVVHALYKDLVERGIAPKLLFTASKKAKMPTRVEKAQKSIRDRGVMNG